MQKESTFRYLTGLGKLALFYFIGLSLFFLAGFVVISVRVTPTEKILVPNVVGHLYLDEHNRLREAGFKVEIEKKELLEYPYGMILAQSLRPGSTARWGARLTLTVNKSKALIQVPRVVGMQKNLVLKLLQEIPRGGRVFQLLPGVVTTIPSQKPKGEVLAQYPLEGTPVLPESTVDLLVSGGPKMSKKGFFTYLKKQSLHIEILKQAAYELKYPLQIKSASTKQENKHAFAKTTQSTPQNLEAVVFRYQDLYSAKKEELAHWPYQLIWFPLAELPLGKYTLIMRSPQPTKTNVALNFASQEKNSILSKAYVVYGGEPIPLVAIPGARLEIYSNYYAPSKPSVSKPQAKSLLDEPKASLQEEQKESKVLPIQVLKL